MKINEIRPPKTNNTPKLGDVVVISYKNGKRVGIIGELNNEVARLYDFHTREVIGTVILKYVHKLPKPSKHPRKVLARHLGLECDDDAPAARYTYEDIKRIKTNMDMDATKDQS